MIPKANVNENFIDPEVIQTPPQGTSEIVYVYVYMFIFFLHLFILQAIYIVSQGFEDGDAICRINIRLQE